MSETIKPYPENPNDTSYNMQFNLPGITKIEDDKDKEVVPQNRAGRRYEKSLKKNKTFNWKKKY